MESISNTHLSPHEVLTWKSPSCPPGSWSMVGPLILVIQFSCSKTLVWISRYPRRGLGGSLTRVEVLAGQKCAGAIGGLHGAASIFWCIPA